jgi:predicted DsbA family dithiol-disulfide isomerase
MRTLEREFGEDLRVEWRSFLLRPQPSKERRTLEEFRRYTHSWERCAADEDSADFRVWATDHGPPSHSVPPHLVAKAAAALDPEAFEVLHDRLLGAYFTENLDITADETHLDLWREVGLPESGFAHREDPELMKRVIEEHNEALQYGASGVPAVRMADMDMVLTGAQPVELYRRWISRKLAEGRAPRGSV